MMSFVSGTSEQGSLGRRAYMLTKTSIPSEFHHILLQHEGLLVIPADMLALVLLTELKLPSLILESLTNLTAHVLHPQSTMSYGPVLEG